MVPFALFEKIPVRVLDMYMHAWSVTFPIGQRFRKSNDTCAKHIIVWYQVVLIDQMYNKKCTL